MRALTALPTALLVLAAVASCDTASHPSAASCSTPGVSADEVKVGFIYPDTGNTADVFRPVRAGLDARFGAINAAGGVNGRKLGYDWADDGGQPDTNQVASRDLIEQKKDFAIVEATASAAGGAPYLAANNIPVAGVSGESVWSTYRNMFTFVNYAQATSSATDVVTTFGQYALSQGGSRALVISDAARTGQLDGPAQKLRDSFASVGIPVSSATMDTAPTQGQLNEIIQKISADKVNILASVVTIDALAQLLVLVRQRNLPLKVILAGSQLPGAELLAQYGPALAGLTSYISPPVNPTSPGYRAYKDAMNRYSPELLDSGQALAQVGYVLGDMVVRGLQAAGPCPTRQGFISGLRAVRNYTVGGLITTTDFDRDFGRIPVCYPLTAVNAAGNGLTTIDPDFCGKRVSK
ncbi:ABC transporter substrate-binding protein [Frankia sp. AiPa1]|uniref:ABC transporter substrate-binding protein n=1 Tax=Frankia sp. AiPa1 TaxID=573492 RepID=UPI00202B3385|nr:ABC transporter substrate-binding protein [Frankia sp. AiPa1]MCL9762618.1 ABC transporter substrate-binding protein [Frankia sp. AiPa1]